MLSRAHFFQFVVFLILIGLTSACGSSQEFPRPSENVSPAITSPAPAIPTPSPTPIPPSATPVPLAARVNGEGITLEEFQAEVKRFLAAQKEAGTSQEPDPEKRVLEDLIAQVLLAQGARQAGFSVSGEELQSRIDQLLEKSGGEQVFLDWLSAQGYTRESFRGALARSIAAAWMRDQIMASVPESVEQVRARQILLLNLDQARQVQVQLQNGKDFATLAAEYDPLAAGDLGWFPRDYLTDPQLEEAAFSLQPGEYSQIVETPLGYHFIQVIERNPQRPLDPDARQVLQSKALEDWVTAHRDQSNVEILIQIE